MYLIVMNGPGVQGMQFQEPHPGRSTSLGAAGLLAMWIDSRMVYAPTGTAEEFYKAKGASGI